MSLSRLTLTSLALATALALVGTAFMLRQGGSQAQSEQPPCGQYPSARPLESAIPTPLVASPGTATGLPVQAVAVVGAWSTCFRPSTVTIHTGTVVQWQAETTLPVTVILDSGSQLGPIKHILEVRFNRPGRYPYRGRPGSMSGVVVVQGDPAPGPAWTTSGGSG